MRTELRKWAAILMLLAGILGFVGLLAAINSLGPACPNGDCYLPFCECGGVQYRSVACAPPPGLPAKCYVHHDDPHASRVW